MNDFIFCDGDNRDFVLAEYVQIGVGYERSVQARARVCYDKGEFHAI